MLSSLPPGVVDLLSVNYRKSVSGKFLDYKNYTIDSYLFIYESGMYPANLASLTCPMKIKSENNIFSDNNIILL